MKPVAITFVDDKMLDIAIEQTENMKQFGIDHEIIRLSDIGAYNTMLWIHLMELTMDAIGRHGKIMRLDAEVRIHKPLPQQWLDNDNVFFQPHPIIRGPFFAAMNTGQMIVGKSGLEFCYMLKECMLALIPPDGDTKITGTDHYVADDDTTSAIALRLSKVKYVQEYLKMDRLDPKICTANRGNWVDDSTILTHPTIHNWNYRGAGMFPIDQIVTNWIIINHFRGDASVANFIVKLMMEKNDGSIWNKIAYRISDGVYSAGGWCFEPKSGLCAPEEYWPDYPKRVDHIHAINQ